MQVKISRAQSGWVANSLYGGIRQVVHEHIYTSHMQREGWRLPSHTRSHCAYENPQNKALVCMLFFHYLLMLCCTYSPNRRRPYLYILSIVHRSTKIPRDLTKEDGKHNWHTSFTHNLHIYLRNNTSQAWQSGTPDPFSHCVLVSQWVITRLSWFGLKGNAV